MIGFCSIQRIIHLRKETKASVNLKHNLYVSLDITYSYQINIVLEGIGNKMSRQVTNVIFLSIVNNKYQSLIFAMNRLSSVGIKW